MQPDARPTVRDAGMDASDATDADADAGAEVGSSDARVEPALTSVLGVSIVDCEGCFELHVRGEGGRPPYRFEWEDGSHGAERRVCPEPAAGAETVTVVVIDADDVRTAPRATQLEFREPDCEPPPELLCLENLSFEGTPQFNSGGEDTFDGAPWTQCTNPASSNSPDIGNDSVEQPIAEVPVPTEGETFLGMFEGEQVSQVLCEPLAGGSERFALIDLRRIYLGAGVTPDTELPFLEVWGGVAADCSQRELLWASEPLEDTWQTYCVPLRPQHYTDQLTLRASSDGSLPTSSYLVADNMVPVESCP